MKITNSVRTEEFNNLREAFTGALQTAVEQGIISPDKSLELTKDLQNFDSNTAIQYIIESTNKLGEKFQQILDQEHNIIDTCLWNGSVITEPFHVSTAVQHDRNRITARSKPELHLAQELDDLQPFEMVPENVEERQEEIRETLIDHAWDDPFPKNSVMALLKEYYTLEYGAMPSSADIKTWDEFLTDRSDMTDVDLILDSIMANTSLAKPAPETLLNIDTISDKIRVLAPTDIEGLKIIVFGSYASGRQTVDSDIDILVQMNDPDHQGNIEQITAILEGAFSNKRVSIMIEGVNGLTEEWLNEDGHEFRKVFP